MNYVSLYRKYRSQDFNELVGQEVIVQTLKNAIKFKRLAHAYLFSGPRGTGKTSTARILAKALNCLEDSTGNPCGKCSNCEKIRLGQAVDVIEIDAASNRGIDEIRELRERVRYAPLEGKYKVYIIDEVHMLTAEAFNALLKTLEEPPTHTIFVLATTELQKVPLTIASRCQRLDFARFKLAEIKGQLQKIAETEKFEIEEKALELIARSAEGAMRDAISLLDQLVSFSGSKIKYDDVVVLLGTADEELLFAFADAVAAGATDKLLALIRRGMEEGRSMPQVTRDLVFHFRNLLHLKVGSGEALELTAEQLIKLAEQAKRLTLDEIKAAIRALSRAELDMKWHPHARLVLEVAMLELLQAEKQNIQPEKIPAIKKTASLLAKPPEIASKTDIEKIEMEKESQQEPPIAGHTVSDTLAASPYEQVKAHWALILENMRKKSIYGYVSLHEGEPLEINAKGKLVIAFRKGYSFHKERLEETKNKEALEESIREVLGNKIMVECIISDGKVASPTLSAQAVAEFFEGKVISR